MTSKTILRWVKGGWARDRAKGGTRAAIDDMRLSATGDGALPPTCELLLLLLLLLLPIPLPVALSPLAGMPAGLHMPPLLLGEVNNWLLLWLLGPAMSLGTNIY